MKTVKVSLEVPYKSIRQAAAVVLGEVWDDEKIDGLFQNSCQIDPLIKGKDEDEMFLQMAVLVVASTMEKPEKPEPKKSKFQERLDQMQEAKRKANGNN